MKYVEVFNERGAFNENLRGDFRGEFVDEGIMIFVHGCTKCATLDVNLLNLDFEFLYLFFEFDVLGTCAARLSTQNLASLRSENFPRHHLDRAVDSKAWIYYSFSIFYFSGVKQTLHTVGFG
jgi:hypothetical protein